jgi:hypothetical protein
MTPRTERVLWALAGAGALLAIVVARHVVPRPVPVVPDSRSVLPTVMSFAPDRLADAADRVIEHDPFRLDRKPARMAFGETGGGTTAPPPTPMRLITLKGVLGGPPWQAVLGGVPGRAGDVVVRTGDSLAGFRVRRVTADRVIIAGPDSAMTLTPYRAWH